MNEQPSRFEDSPELEEFERQAKENPDDLTAQRQYAWALYAAMQFDEAVKLFKNLAEHSPADAEAHYALGLASREAGDVETAKRAFEAALDHVDGLESEARATMMRRLAEGNLSFLAKGSWKTSSMA